MEHAGIVEGDQRRDIFRILFCELLPCLEHRDEQAARLLQLFRSDLLPGFSWR